MAVDSSGNLFIADGYNNRVRKVSSSGIITTVAGNGTQGFSGDDGPATSAELAFPVAVALDASGNLFIADLYNNRIRKVSTTGTITTVAGNGAKNVQSGLGSYSGDNGPATSAGLNYPYGVAVDASGNLYIADLYNYRVRKVSTSGTITTIAGNGQSGFAGDDGPAISAQLDEPFGIAVDTSGNIFSYAITATTGCGRSPQAAPSRLSRAMAPLASPVTAGLRLRRILAYPKGIAVDAAGNLFIADFSNSVIRKVSAHGTISTVAGNGSFGYSGDGGPATSAELDFPPGVAVDAAGNLFIADTESVIRKVSASGSTFTPSISSGGIVPVGSNVPAIQVRRVGVHLWDQPGRRCRDVEREFPDIAQWHERNGRWEAGLSLVRQPDPDQPAGAGR